MLLHLEERYQLLCKKTVSTSIFCALIVKSSMIFCKAYLLFCFLIFYACFFQDKVNAEDGITVNLGSKSPALHFLMNRSSVFVTPAQEDYAYMLYDLCDAMGLSTADECEIYPMNADLGGNAIATIADGSRVIVYDRQLSPKVGYGGAMMIVAHELGHHFCRHIGTQADPKKELEADRFAGAAMRKAGYSLEDALAAVVILHERPSRSHPGRSDRVKAITAGWNSPETGKDCR